MLLLDGSFSHTLAVARELKIEFHATVLGVGTDPKSALLRSRYCDIGLIAPPASAPTYPDRVLSLAIEFQPDLIFPVGFHSHAALLSIRHQLPRNVRTTISISTDSFNVASNKAATYQLAQSLGIDVPLDLTANYIAAIEQRAFDELHFPVFLKAEAEAGGVTTALVHSVDQLQYQYARIRDAFGPVLIQEFIDSGPSTFAHCGYFERGSSVIALQQWEVRSVPRHGGSGTRVRTFSDRNLSSKAEALLGALDWDGVAQVEFKQRHTGEYVLMEVNPKMWASYALAYHAGYPIASLAVAHALGQSQEAFHERKKRNIDMVFPIREAKHVLNHLREENPLRAMAAMVWPPAAVDFDFLDVAAHLPSNPLPKAWGKLRQLLRRP